VGRSFVAAAQAAVSRAGDVVVEMGSWTSEGRPAARVCREKVAGCEVFVGIVGFRYGSLVADDPGRSYTELEFDAAGEAGLDRRVFLVGEDSGLPRPVADEEFGGRQEAFRARLLDGLTVQVVSSPEQLELLLYQALVESAAGRADDAPPGDGWGVPPVPGLVGRVEQVGGVVAAVTGVPPPPVAVVGAPGIGKTTVCLAALHEPSVVGRFGARRWFVRCDGAFDAGAVWAGLAGEVGLSGQAGGSLPARVVGVLATGPGLVVFDNLETPWAADPLGVEELVGRLAGVAGVAVVVSMRGSARPGGVGWAGPVVVPPLSDEQARTLFVRVAGAGFAADPGLGVLVSALDGMPLAVELAGYAAQGQPDLAGVLRRWRAERVGLLARAGGGRRELSVAVSVEVSVSSPAMTAAGRRLLGLLGVLPDGVAHADLAGVLPGVADAAAGVVRQVGLGFDEAGRLRVLAPVREHLAESHPPEPADVEAAVGFYCRLAADEGGKVGGPGGAGAAVRLAAEVGNLTVMVGRAVRAGRLDVAVDAAEGLSRYARFTGVGLAGVVADVAEAAGSGDDPGLTARARLAVGDVALARSDHDGARESYTRALPLYRQVGDLLGEATCIQRLGDIALRRSDHDGARESYTRALPLFRRVGSVLGEANCVQRLGDIALERSDHDGARESYTRALPLYRQVGSVLGEANCIQRLGDIALHRSDHDGARESYTRALALYRRVGDLRGEANCIYYLGDVALARSDHDGAREAYTRALPLFQRVGSVRGEADCIQGLGDVALARSDHDGARDAFTRALPLYQRMSEPHSIGMAHRRLARLATDRDERQRHVAEARRSWLAIGRPDLVEQLRGEFGESL
jgi:tetratricopeptide (TPR) repeat protein